jgi:hypothetical protein
VKKVKKQAGPIAQPTVQVLRRGLAANLEERDILLERGLEEREVYTNGQGAESFEECLWSFRDRPGELWLVSDLRIFGNSRVAILAVTKDLHERGITLKRIMPVGEITNPSELIEQALKAISGNRFKYHMQAQRTGKKGGAAKGFHEKKRRDERVAEEIVRKMVIELGIRRTAKILGKPFTRQTLDRHYT